MHGYYKSHAALAMVQLCHVCGVYRSGFLDPRYSCRSCSALVSYAHCRGLVYWAWQLSKGFPFAKGNGRQSLESGTHELHQTAAPCQVEKLALAEGSKVVLATMQSAVNQVGALWAQEGACWYYCCGGLAYPHA